MSGIYSGVQKRILAIQPKAVYVHCAAHNLNLVINDAVCKVQETASFFTTLEDLYVFFGHSIRRWDLLKSFTSESEVKLKRLNPTRWAGRLASVMSEASFHRRDESIVSDHPTECQQRTNVNRQRA